MIRQIKKGNDYVAGVQIYLCETYNDINDVPNKNFGDRFLVLNSNDDSVKSYIVNGNNQIVEYQETIEAF